MKWRYHIGQNIFGIMGELTEIPVSYYVTLEQTFEDDKIYRERNIEYLDANWRTMVCMTEGVG